MDERPTIKERNDLSDCVKCVYSLKNDNNLGAKLANIGFKAKDAPLDNCDGKAYLRLRQCPFRECPDFVLAVNLNPNTGEVYGLCASKDVAREYQKK